MQVGDPAVESPVYFFVCVQYSHLQSVYPCDFAFDSEVE